MTSRWPEIPIDQHRPTAEFGFVFPEARCDRVGRARSSLGSFFRCMRMAVGLGSFCSTRGRFAVGFVFPGPGPGLSRSLGSFFLPDSPSRSRWVRFSREVGPSGQASRAPDAVGFVFPGTKRPDGAGWVRFSRAVGRRGPPRDRCVRVLDAAGSSASNGLASFLVGGYLAAAQRWGATTGARGDPKGRGRPRHGPGSEGVGPQCKAGHGWPL